MQTYPKKRIELVIETPLLRRVTERLDQAGVSGYTVHPIIAGRGPSGDWTADSLIGDAGHMVSVVCIVDPGRVDALLEQLFAIVRRQIGFVTVSDVSVVRAERF